MRCIRDGSGNISMVKLKQINTKRADCKTSRDLLIKLGKNKGLVIPDYVDAEIRNFIKTCCVFEKKKRPSAKLLLNSKFFY